VGGGFAVRGGRALQSVVKLWRRTETGEAPRGQGATTKNTGQYLREEQRRPRGCIARRMQPEFHHGLFSPATMNAFKDHFSERAADYAKFRPRYPDALFDWLASEMARHDLALDVATGNGQAAVALAPHYRRVIAIDLSSEQIAHAMTHPAIEYRVAAADRSGLPDASVDLVTVAQALHWLPFAAFFDEVRRVLNRTGLFAAWGYRKPSVAPRFDAVFAGFCQHVESCWPTDRIWVEQEYRTIPIPLTPVPSPSFAMESLMTFEAFAGYLRTWSASKRFVTEHGTDPVAPYAQALARAWPGPGAQVVRFPLFVRAGRIG
jgi:hypothetical protein